MVPSRRSGAGKALPSSTLLPSPQAPLLRGLFLCHVSVANRLDLRPKVLVA